MTLVMTLAVGACAGPAERANMAVSNLSAPIEPVDGGLMGGIAVASVEGGRETNPLWTSEVGDEDFRGALNDSLRTYGWLSEGEAPRYILRAHLLEIRQPLVGLDMTVTAKVRYELVDAVNEEPSQAETVTTEHTVTYGQAFAADDRVRMANEGAIRGNIQEFLTRLTVKPPPSSSTPVAEVTYGRDLEVAYQLR
jgi:hypothetical protein